MYLSFMKEMLKYTGNNILSNEVLYENKTIISLLTALINNSQKKFIK